MIFKEKKWKYAREKLPKEELIKLINESPAEDHLKKMALEFLEKDLIGLKWIRHNLYNRYKLRKYSSDEPKIYRTKSEKWQQPFELAKKPDLTSEQAKQHIEEINVRFIELLDKIKESIQNYNYMLQVEYKPDIGLPIYRRLKKLGFSITGRHLHAYLFRIKINLIKSSEALKQLDLCSELKRTLEERSNFIAILVDLINKNYYSFTHVYKETGTGEGALVRGELQVNLQEIDKNLLKYMFGTKCIDKISTMPFISILDEQVLQIISKFEVIKKANKVVVDKIIGKLEETADEPKTTIHLPYTLISPVTRFCMFRGWQLSKIDNITAVVDRETIYSKSGFILEPIVNGEIRKTLFDDEKANRFILKDTNNVLLGKTEDEIKQIVSDYMFKLGIWMVKQVKQMNFNTYYVEVFD